MMLPLRNKESTFNQTIDGQWYQYYEIGQTSLLYSMKNGIGLMKVSNLIDRNDIKVQ